MILTASATIRNQWNPDEIREETHTFGRVDALESWLAYNRAYILTLSFTGEFVRDEE